MTGAGLQRLGGWGDSSQAAHSVSGEVTGSGHRPRSRAAKAWKMVLKSTLNAQLMGGLNILFIVTVRQREKTEGKGCLQKRQVERETEEEGDRQSQRNREREKEIELSSLGVPRVSTAKGTKP